MTPDERAARRGGAVSSGYVPEPCPGCPEVRLDCACVISLEGMALADIKAVFADECIDHEWPDCGGHNHDEALSVDPAVTP